MGSSPVHIEFAPAVNLEKGACCVETTGMAGRMRITDKMSNPIKAKAWSVGSEFRSAFTLRQSSIALLKPR
jgi:hypothetical protein